MSFDNDNNNNQQEQLKKEKQQQKDKQETEQKDDNNNYDDDNNNNSNLKDDSEFTTNWDTVIDSFDDMNLREELLRGIYGIGFEKPSAIQQRGILPVIKGHDTIAQAQSGTGKTATFSIAALQVLDIKESNCQVLVLAPTRELAQQIWSVKYFIFIIKISHNRCVFTN